MMIKFVPSNLIPATGTPSDVGAKGDTEARRLAVPLPAKVLMKPVPISTLRMRLFPLSAMKRLLLASKTMLKAFEI